MNIGFGRLWNIDMVHPLEHDATLDFQKSGIVDWLAREAGSLKMRMTSRAEANLRNYAVSVRTAPRLHGIYTEVLRRMQCDQEYPLFVAFGYDLVAQTYGSQRDGYTIIVNSACLDVLTDGELAALLGHEIGHIRGGHVQNLELLRSIESLVKTIPAAGALTGKQIWSYFSKWMIASEYTADRAALFASSSMTSVLSLLLKQMGVDPVRVTPAEVAATPTDADVDRLGIYFVWLAQALPVYGGVQRVKELTGWVLSGAFKREYPAFHYFARLESGDAAEDDADGRLLDLHQRTMDGNMDALVTLANLYLTGGGLPQAPETAVSLLERASYSGDGTVMYTLAKCMKHELVDLKNDPRRIARLTRAAASRGCEAAKAACEATPGGADMDALTVYVRAFAAKDRRDASCHVNVDEPGQPLDTARCVALADALWIDRSEPIYAAEADAVGAAYGLAVTPSGLYGRLPGDRFPFAVSWREFDGAALAQRETVDGHYLFVGDHRVVRRREKLGGSVIELLLLIKSGQGEGGVVK